MAQPVHKLEELVDCANFPPEVLLDEKKPWAVVQALVPGSQWP